MHILNKKELKEVIGGVQSISGSDYNLLVTLQHDIYNAGFSTYSEYDLLLQNYKDGGGSGATIISDANYYPTNNTDLAGIHMVKIDFTNGTEWIITTKAFEILNP